MNEVDDLRARVATLEHLLEVHESVFTEQARKLEAARAEANERAAEARLLSDAIAERNRELEASQLDNSELVERLRRSVDELSNPILEVWDDVLVMPIIGIVDSLRVADMVQRLLSEVARLQAAFVIVDLTGVDIIDTKTADHLIKLMRKVEIVGARCVLTGIRPAVSETLVEIGVDFGRVSTLRNLKHGLREALRHKRRHMALRDELLDAEDPDDARATEARPRSR